MAERERTLGNTSYIESVLEKDVERPKYETATRNKHVMTEFFVIFYCSARDPYNGVPAIQRRRERLWQMSGL